MSGDEVQKTVKWVGMRFKRQSSGWGESSKDSVVGVDDEVQKTVKWVGMRFKRQ